MAERQNLIKWITVVVVACGFALRVVVYLYNRSLALDEAMLATNLVFRNLGDALVHLEYNQIAPPIFLALSKLSLIIFKDVAISLHLVPLVSGALALWLFSALARRLVPGWFAVATTAIAAFHFLYLRYSTVFKQYSCDYLVTALLFVIALNWGNRSVLWRWVLAAILPLLIGLSLTAVFGIFALIAVLLWHAVARKDRSSYISCAILASSTTLVSSLLWFLFLRQYRSEPFFFEFWRSGFPDSNLAWWTVRATGDVFAYLVGYPPLTIIWAILCLVGLVALFGKETRSAAVFCTACLSAGLGAAIVRLYPFSAERVTLWLFPVALICLAKGLDALWHIRPIRIFKPMAVAVILFLLLWTGASIAVQGHELWEGEQMRTVLERLSETQMDRMPVLVSKFASYSYRLFHSERADQASFVLLPCWTITAEEIGRGWQDLGSPERFCLVLTGGDAEHVKPAWPVLLRYCTLERKIERGSSGAYLLELRPREEWPDH